MNLEKWASDYRKYIQFQAECLPYAYQYGGMKFNANDFPSFELFCEYLGTDRCFIQHKYATDIHFDYQWSNVMEKHNCIKQPHRWDLYKCRITYSDFRGVKFNFKIEYNTADILNKHEDFEYLIEKIKA